MNQPCPTEHPSRDGAPLAVRARALLKRYPDGTQANRGISLDVRRGEIISILGPNGAGKTTFLRQLTTELKPTSGDIAIFGINAVAAPEQAKRLMGIMPQEAGLFESLTLREHFEFFARIKGLTRGEARTATQEMIAALDLNAETEKRVGHLSGGQRRRILVGLALLGKPPLLVLDEPTTGLDPASRRAVWHVIRRAVVEGATAVLSTHYMEEAERLSDHIGIICAGRLIACGTLDELFAGLNKSYRLAYCDTFDELREDQIFYFATFAEAQRHASLAGLAEFSISRASLEDVFFKLTGERFSEQGDGGRA